MNVGDIYARLSIDNSDFTKKTDEAVGSIRKFGKFVDDIMTKTSNSVKGAGVSFKNVQDTVSDLAQEVKKAKPIINAPESEWKTYDTLHGYLAQIKERFKELGADGGTAFRKVRNEVDSALASATTVGNGLTAMRNQLRELGKEDATAATTQKMADLRLQVTKANNELKLMSQDGFEEAITSSQALFSVFQVGIGALGMFGIESEKLNKTMVSSMGILQGLTTIQQLYSKGVFANIINLVKETGVKIANTLATAGATKAQIAFNTALMANPIGLVLAGVVALGVAIWGLVTAFKHFNNTSSEAERIQKNVNEAFAKGMVEAMQERVQVDVLFSSLLDLNSANEDRKKTIEEINEKYGEYLPNLLEEWSTLKEIEEAYNLINRAVLETMKNKVLQSAQEKQLESFASELEEVNNKVVKYRNEVSRLKGLHAEALAEGVFMRVGEIAQELADNQELLEKYENKQNLLISQTENNLKNLGDEIDEVFSQSEEAYEGLNLSITDYQKHVENLTEQSAELNVTDKQRFDTLKKAYIDDARQHYESVLAKIRAERGHRQVSLENIKLRQNAEQQYLQAMKKFDEEVAKLFKKIKQPEVKPTVELTELQKLEKALDDLNIKTTEKLLLQQDVADVTRQQVQAELDLWARYIASNKATEEQIKHFEELLEIRESLKVTQKDNVEQEKEEVEQVDKLNEALIKLNRESVIKLGLGESLEAVTKGMIKTEMDLLYAHILTGDATEEQIDRYKELRNANENMEESNKELSDSFKDLGNQISETMSRTVGDMATASIEMLASGESMSSVGLMIMGTFADMAIQIGKVAVGTGIAIEGIKTALKSLNPYVVLAAGASLIALGGFIKGQLKTIANPQGLATGGIVTQGGVFEVGEKGREHVYLPTGSAVVPNHLINGNVNNNGNFIASTRINGRDLEIILERTAVQTKRR